MRNVFQSVFSAAAILLISAFAPGQPLTTHPRLWVTSADLPRLQSWAVPGNQIYGNGLALLAASAKADMDNGFVPAGDGGGTTYETYPSEMYAEIFAFMSLLSTDPPTRDDYANRARTCLMYVINAALPGAASGVPFRDPRFSISDRSRWHGEAFGLTVDWIYPYLSAGDKASIATVFGRWISEDINADTTTDNHPVPVGVFNDPILTSDPIAVRWAANNYYTAHMRNIGLMSMSLDASDDPGGIVTPNLADATGAWLYVVDYLMRNDSRGGLAPEGFEYSPQAVGYVAQFLLALHTSGEDNPVTWGAQVVLTGNPFWSDYLPAFLHSLSPLSATSADPNYSYLGPLYEPAWYGACQNFWAPDFIEGFGPLGIYDVSTGNTSRAQSIRWVETNTPPGGSADLYARVSDPSGYFQKSIFAFLLFDPAAPAPADPRPALPVTFFSPGIGRLSSRSDWSTTASFFTYALGWNSIDHQAGDGNAFELYRQGEWLTKQRCGYDLDYLASDNHNCLGLENDPSPRCPGSDYRCMLTMRGSQLMYVNSGNPQILAQSTGPGYVYAMGDATNLYNSASEGQTDILHASRSIFWLPPDHIVVYDRAVSQTAGRFKRFYVNSANPFNVVGTLSTTTNLPSGQKLFVSTLLPSGATITSETAPVEASGLPANLETMQDRLRVEDASLPSSVRFLHVLQGADAAASADAASLLQSTAGTPFDGALVNNTAVLFPNDLSIPFSSVSYTVPASTVAQFVSGLAPGANYTITQNPSGNTLQMMIAPGGSSRTADSGGVLSIYPPVNTTALKFYTIAPCRVIDTRGQIGTYGGPALQGGTSRAFPVSGQCGIPTQAAAISVNITAVAAPAIGDLRLYPTGTPVPNASAINFSAGRTRANNAVLSLAGGPPGSVTVHCDIAAGAVQMLLDVNGYFQ